MRRGGIIPVTYLLPCCLHVVADPDQAKVDADAVVDVSPWSTWVYSPVVLSVLHSVAEPRTHPEGILPFSSRHPHK